MTTEQPLSSRFEPEPACDPETLRNKITELSAHIYAATYRLLVLIRELDRTDGWAEEGVASCAHWLNAFCGTGMVAAREKVRVARALHGLPKISRALETGKISYSKARAMTRVATAENESCLLDIGLYGTAAQVERVVRLYRGVKDLAEAKRQHARRELTHYHDEDGSLVIRARMPAEQGAMVLIALNRAMDLAFRERHDVSAESPKAADNPPAESRSSVSDDSKRQPPQAQTPDDAISSTRRCGTAVSMDEDDSAESWDPVIIDTEDCNAARRLDALVDVAESYLASGPSGSATADRYQVVVHVDRPALDDHAAHRCGLESGQELAAETGRRIACDCGLIAVRHDGESMNIGRKSRVVPAGMRRALKMRDEGCRFPGCTRQRYVDAHHITHWADGGETSLENLVQLCRYHHRIVHEGGFSMQRTDTGELRVLNPKGRRVTTDNCIDIDVDFARFLERMTALGVNPETCVPKLYGGDRLDYDHAIWLLANRDGIDG